MSAIGSRPLRLYRAAPEDNGRRPADPGDFGSGSYWTTSRARAGSYGRLVKVASFRFRNPIICTVADAYTVADLAGTIHGPAREAVCAELSADYKRAGVDAVIVIHARELEVVVL